MPQADSPIAMIGQTLGHYRVLEEIGSGGMGEVYRACDDRLGREVALKVLKPSLANDRDRLRRFEQEARAAAALSHPNIVAVYDIGNAQRSALHRLRVAAGADSAATALQWPSRVAPGD